MLGKIFSFLIIFSFFAAIITGNVEKMSLSVLKSANNAIQLVISLCGVMTLWSGIASVMEASGLTARLSKVLKPLLKFLFPGIYKSGNGISEVTNAISANLLGLGNASTPLAISAMKKMKLDTSDSLTATDDMIMFTVISTASFNIFPTTIVALRSAAGSENAFSVIIPIWISSLLSTLIAIMITKLLRRFL